MRKEVWKSDNNQEEIHLFIGNEYVIGFNPRYISKKVIERIVLDSLDEDCPEL